MTLVSVHDLRPKQHLSATDIKTVVKVALAGVVHLVGESSQN